MQTQEIGCSPKNGRLGVYLVSVTEGHNVASRNIERQKGIPTKKLKLGDITKNHRRHNNLGKILGQNPILSASSCVHPTQAVRPSQKLLCAKRFAGAHREECPAVRSSATSLTAG